MLVKDLTNHNPNCIFEDSTILQATLTLSNTGMSELMVVDIDHNLVGVLGEVDLLSFVMPDFEEIHAAGGSLQDAFTLFSKRGSILANYSIAPLINRSPLTALPWDEAAQVAALMLHKQLRCLPVIEGRKLQGTISRLDICLAVICGTKNETNEDNLIL